MMLSHFQYQELKNNLINQEWKFSFFYQRKKYVGTYFKDGSIKWENTYSLPSTELMNLEKAVHDLMLYHVYEDH